RALAVRFVVSFFNAAVTALLLGVFYFAVRGLGPGPGAALAATLLLGFTTPLWVYAKSFMAEPLQALGLLLALAGSVRAEDTRWRWLAGLGVLLAISVKASMAPMAIACVIPLFWAHPPRDWAPVLIGLALAVAGLLVYDLARFGNPFE